MAKTASLRIYVEPPVPLATEFATVDHVRSVIRQLDQGSFRMPALLLERMMWNPRLRGAMGTRMAGLIATEVRFKPSRNNKDGRRAAKELREDWPLMLPTPHRKQMMEWGLMLGFGLSQRVPGESPISQRHIFKLAPYWPGFADWYWAQKAYRIQTSDRGVTAAATPSVDRAAVESFVTSPVLGDVAPVGKSSWVIAEPFGVNSYRKAMLHAAWRPWLGHEWAMRDQARASEKHGVGILKAKYPRGEGDEHEEAQTKFENGLRRVGAEAVVPLEQREDGQPSFDVEPLEFNGSGFSAISDTLNSNAVALAILFLGHNLTTEIKGGSYAAAGVADYIRDDVKYDDGGAEADYLRPQLLMPWAEANYGDPGLAPLLEYVTDSPAVNLNRAQMVNFLAMAIAQLRANLPRADLDRLAEEFDVPLLAQQPLVQVPAALPASPATTEEQP